MKVILVSISLLLTGVVAEAPAPYPPSGFRPAGPAFELPERPQKTQQQYLPPLDPRQPLSPADQYGAPEDDVSVQGLPTQEQQPIFQASPVNGQQYTGPNFNSDIKNLDDSYRQAQYQIQQEKYREYERQRQVEAAQARNRANQASPQVPRQFGTESTISTTEVTTRNPEDFRTTESTTEFDLNEGETLDDKRDDKKDKVQVEVSKQNLQEYPGELFLSSLAQLQLQPQFVPLQQFGQIKAPLYYQPIQQEPSQNQIAGFDAATHFAALPSVLAQQQYIQAQQGFVQNPGFQQQVLVGNQQPSVGFIPQNPQPQFNQYQPAVQQAQLPQAQFSQYQPAVQVQSAQFDQYQPIQPQGFAQPVVVQPESGAIQFGQQPQNLQPNQYAQTQPESEDEQNDQDQPQFVYQQSYQPQEVIYQQPQPQQAFNQFQPQEQQTVFLQAPQPQAAANPNQPQVQPNGFLPQAQLVMYPQPLVQQYQNGIASQYQNGLAPQQFTAQPQIPQPGYQGQNAFTSGNDVSQDDNGIEQNEEKDNEANEGNPDDGSTSIAVATAFGARTQPRVLPRYGAPAVPRGSANPQSATEDTAQNEETEDTAAVAVANAVATNRRKSAKLRSRRVRPVFTLDRSGHLVLAQEQNQN